MRNWYRSTIGGLPRLYWYLWTGMLINRVGGFVALVLSLYLTSDRHLGAPSPAWWWAPTASAGSAACCSAACSPTAGAAGRPCCWPTSARWPCCPA